MFCEGFVGKTHGPRRGICAFATAAMVRSGQRLRWGGCCTWAHMMSHLVIGKMVVPGTHYNTHCFSGVYIQGFFKLRLPFQKVPIIFPEWSWFEYTRQALKLDKKNPKAVGFRFGSRFGCVCWGSSKMEGFSFFFYVWENKQKFPTTVRWRFIWSEISVSWFFLQIWFNLSIYGPMVDCLQPVQALYRRALARKEPGAPDLGS